MRNNYLNLLFLIVIFLFCGSQAFSKDDRRYSSIFYQDKDYIYRSIPYSFDFDRMTYLPDLMQEASRELLETVRELVRANKRVKNQKLREKILAEIESFDQVQDHIELFSDEIRLVKDRVPDRFRFSDLAPKALLIHIGGSVGIGIASLPVSIGLILFIDRVDRIAKKDLGTFTTEEELGEAFIESKFADLDISWGDDWHLASNSLSRKPTVSHVSGLPVASYYQIDAAPVFVATPGVGIGIGGGVAMRLGINAIWWKGNRLVEPEDVYGWGFAFSQDFSAGIGYNWKFGVINSKNYSPPDSHFDSRMDYLFGGLSFELGPKLVASPSKGNLVLFRPLGKVLDQTIENIENTADKEFDQLVDGLTNAIEQKLLDEEG